MAAENVNGVGGEGSRENAVAKAQASIDEVVEFIRDRKDKADNLIELSCLMEAEEHLIDKSLNLVCSEDRLDVVAKIVISEGDARKVVVAFNGRCFSDSQFAAAVLEELRAKLDQPGFYVSALKPVIYREAEEEILQ